MGLLFHYGFGLGDACGAPGRFHNIHVKINELLNLANLVIDITSLN